MIINTLMEYYDRKAALGDIARYGWSALGIRYVLVLTPQGQPVDLLPLFTQKDKVISQPAILVPSPVTKTSNPSADFLWGNPDYIFGLPNYSKCKTEEAKAKEDELAQRRVAKFVEKVDEIVAAFEEDAVDEGVLAVKKFMALKDRASLMDKFPAWKELREHRSTMTFRLAGDMSLLLERPAVREIHRRMKDAKDTTSKKGICLDTGKMAPLEDKHQLIVYPDPTADKCGPRTYRPTSGKLISFNQQAFCSQGLKGNDNAPMSKGAAHAYTAAMNHLYRRESKQWVCLDGVAFGFWAGFQFTPKKGDGKSIAQNPNERNEPYNFEQQVYDLLLGPQNVDDPERGTNDLGAELVTAGTGVLWPEKDPTRFHVLGITPSGKGRIAVRFWHEGTVAELTRNIRQFCQDVSIVHHSDASDTLSLMYLLRHTTRDRFLSSLTPGMGVAAMKAVLDCRVPYPLSMMQATLLRVGLEKRVLYPHAAMAKAYLNRLAAINNTREEIKVGLDKNNTMRGYLWGREFATYEKLQATAIDGVKFDVRQAFFGKALIYPLQVHRALADKSTHHLARMKRYGMGGLAVWYEKVIREIVDKRDPVAHPLPSVLPLQEQSEFICGYHQQMQEFYTKKVEEDVLLRGEDPTTAVTP